MPLTTDQPASNPPIIIDAAFEAVEARLASGDRDRALITLAANSGLALDQLSPGLRRSLEAGLKLADSALAGSSQDVYERAFCQFQLWCEDEELPALPASVLAVLGYVGFMADELQLSASRINVMVSAIAWQHRRRRLPDPTTDTVIALALKGTRRLEATTRTRRQAKPLVAKIGARDDEVAILVDAITGDDLASLRDRALILLGWAGAFRRSELASLTIGDLQERPEGYWIPARKSKTDQEGKDAAEGKGKAVHLAETPAHCPVRAVKHWLAALEAATGREAAAGQSGRLRLPVFVGCRVGKRIRDQQGKVVGHALIPATTTLSGQTVNDVVKARSQAVAAGEVSGHSLRRGFVTTAIENDKDIFAVQAQTGHKSIDMLAQYKGQVDAFARGAGKGLL